MFSASYKSKVVISQFVVVWTVIVVMVDVKGVRKARVAAGSVDDEATPVSVAHRVLLTLHQLIPSRPRYPRSSPAFVPRHLAKDLLPASVLGLGTTWRNMNQAASSSSSLALLADPPMRLMDGAAMDYFQIELVEALRHSSSVATARAKKIEQEMIESGLIPPPPPPAPTLRVKKDVQRESLTSNASQSAIASKSPLDEEEEEVRVRLEAIGLHVGANITER